MAATSAGFEAAGDALVNRGGIQKTVAQHEAAGSERGTDDLAHELGAAGGEQQKFGLRQD